MTSLQTILDLHRHMAWADAAVWKAVLSSEGARSDEAIRSGLHHTHVVQSAFLRAWRGEKLDSPFPEFEEAASLAAWGRRCHRELSDHLESFTEESISQPMPLPWADRVAKRLGRAPEGTTIGDTALQVALHSVHHRAQINRRLREVGGEPPLVDYIAWVWLGRPAPDWPSEAAGGA